MNEELLITIEIDGDDAAKDAAKIDNALEDVEAQAVRTEKAAKGFGRTVKREMSSSVVDLSGKVRGQANVALTDFNRIVQDAPFGLVAVQNNITQLVESFGRLSASQGAVGALKSMAASLAGPAGLVALVSLASSAFLIFGQRSKKAVADTNTELERMQGAIESIVKADQDPMELLLGSEEDAKAALDRVEGLIDGYRASIEAMRESGGMVDAEEIFVVQNLENQLEILEPLRDRIAEVADEYDLMRRVFDVSSLVIPPEVEESVRSYQAALEDVALAIRGVVEVQGENMDIQLQGRYANEAVLADLKSQKEATERVMAAEVARREAIRESIEATIAAADKSIKTAQDAAAAVIDAIRQEIQAYIAKAIAAQISATGPLAVVLGAGIAAATNLMFNSLIPDFSGESSSGGGVARAQPDTSSLRGRIDNSLLAPVTAMDPGLLVEMRMTREAIENKKWRVSGFDLETSGGRVQALRNQAGQP